MQFAAPALVAVIARAGAGWVKPVVQPVPDGPAENREVAGVEDLGLLEEKRLGPVTLVGRRAGGQGVGSVPAMAAAWSRLMVALLSARPTRG
jgi:hypothetical protein